MANVSGNSSPNHLKGTAAADRINGRRGDDTLDGGVGNDYLSGDGGNDYLFGDGGNDTLIWDAADVKVDGGSGTDTLKVTGTRSLDLTTVADARIAGIEIVHLAGANTLMLSASDVRRSEEHTS